MSSGDHHEPAMAQSGTTAHDITTTPSQPGDTSSQIPEMTDLENKVNAPTTAQSDSYMPITEPEARIMPKGPARTDTSTALAQATAPPSPPPPMPSSPNPLSRTVSSAIGPSVDQPILPTKDEEETGPILQITLLLTNGARHPFKLDAKYLAKRNVEVQGGDPYNLSVYKLKELILREWREEWELKPASPSYIRLISFGRLLDDKAALKDQRFNNENPNVVHMTIKPQDFVDEEDAQGKGGKTGSTGYGGGVEGRSPGCRCVIM